MNRETTPVRISEKVMELCNQVLPEANPEYIPVIESKWSLQNECFNNVEKMVKDYGGKQVNGWAIWQWANALIEAEAHAIWESPEGKLIDITSHSNNERNILFLRDDTICYNGYSIDNIRMALTKSPLIDELIKIKKELFEITSKYKSGEPVKLGEYSGNYLYLATRHNEIMQLLHEKVERNDPCPCKSGLKYKKCCGRYEQ